MKKFTKGLRPIIAIIIAIILTITAAAAVVIARQWGTAAIFCGHIEQPANAAVELVLSANGEEFTDAWLETDGNMTFPIMEPTHHTGDNTWCDDDGKVAVKAPTITLSTRGGDMDMDVFYKIEVHATQGTAPGGLPADVAEALKFKTVDNYYDADGNWVGRADTGESLGLTMKDEGGYLYAETGWQHIPQTVLREGEYATVDISAFAVGAAEGEFYCKVVFASGDRENALGHIPVEPEPIPIEIPVGES